jgi:hypothetical protein
MGSPLMGKPLAPLGRPIGEAHVRPALSGLGPALLPGNGDSPPTAVLGNSLGTGMGTADAAAFVLHAQQQQQQGQPAPSLKQYKDNSHQQSNGPKSNLVGTTSGELAKGTFKTD